MQPLIVENHHLKSGTTTYCQCQRRSSLCEYFLCQKIRAHGMLQPGIVHIAELYSTNLGKTLQLVLHRILSLKDIFQIYEYIETLILKFLCS